MRRSCWSFEVHAHRNMMLLHAWTVYAAAALQSSVPSAVQKNSILPLRLPTPTRGPWLTATHTWRLLSPDVKTLQVDQRMQLMKASLVAFICLNDHSTAGKATILTSVRNARTAVRHSSERWDTSASVLAARALTSERWVAHIIAILLRASSGFEPEPPFYPAAVIAATGLCANLRPRDRR